MSLPLIFYPCAQVLKGSVFALAVCLPFQVYCLSDRTHCEESRDSETTSHAESALLKWSLDARLAIVSYIHQSTSLSLVNICKASCKCAHFNISLRVIACQTGLDTKKAALTSPIANGISVSESSSPADCATGRRNRHHREGNVAHCIRGI